MMSGKSDSHGAEILVVDNDTSCRKFLQVLLVRQGYMPIVAENAERAVDLIEQAPEAPRLVITDVFLGKQNGFELVSRIRQRFKDVKVLFTSGFSEVVLRDFGFHLDAPFIEKPICMNVMRATLAGLLEPAVAAAV